MSKNRVRIGQPAKERHRQGPQERVASPLRAGRPGYFGVRWSQPTDATRFSRRRSTYSQQGASGIMATKEKTDKTAAAQAAPWGTNVKVEFEDGIAWVILNRPQ